MDDLVLPDTVDGLVDLLDTLFPDRCPALGTPADKVWHDAGARSVVNLLLALRARRDNPEQP